MSYPPRRRRRRVTASTGVLALVLAVLAALVPGSAGAAARTVTGTDAPTEGAAVDPAVGGAVSGTVTDPGGRPVAGASVLLMRVETGRVERVERTGPDGTYQVAGLVPGLWTVTVEPPDGLGLSAWAAPAPLTVDAGTVAVLDARLVTGGSITGRVTDVRGSGVAGVLVTANTDPPSPPAGFGWAQTGPDGSYVLSGLAAGSYVVLFQTPQGARTHDEFYDDSGTWDAARRVPVQVGVTTGGIDARVPAPGLLSSNPQRVVSDLQVPAGEPRCVTLRHRMALPADATAVAVNVTTVAPSGPGHVVVYPDSDGTGATPPGEGSTVNFDPGADVANAAFVALPPNGQICYATRGAAAGILIDVTGHLRAGAGIETRSPVRLLDSRPGAGHVGDLTGPVRPRTPTSVQVTGRAGVPTGATGVLLNVTVTGTRAPGHLRVYPAGQPVPNASVVNYVPGRDRASATIVPLSADGRLSLWSDTDAGTATNPVQVVLDVVGWTTGGAGYVPVTPTRVLDTRAGLTVGPLRGPLAGNVVHSVPLRGVGPVPAGATAAVLTVTAVAPSTSGNLRVYPDLGATGQTPPPGASTLNYVPGTDTANLVVVGLTEDGRVDFYSDQGPGGSVQLTADVVGYVTGG
jgi:Carboxypeptidase regulatory-like domain